MKLLLQGDRIAGTATDEYQGPMAWVMAPDDYDPGMEYRVVDGVFVVQVPSAVTSRQGVEQIIEMGLLETVEGTIAAIEDDKVRAKAQNYWLRSQVFERRHPLMQLLGLTDEQLDQAFIEAAQR